MWKWSTPFKGIVLWEISKEDSERLSKVGVRIYHFHWSKERMGNVDLCAIWVHWFIVWEHESCLSWKESKHEAWSNFCGWAPGHSLRSCDRKGLAQRDKCDHQIYSKVQEESHGVKRTHTLKEEGPFIKLFKFHLHSPWQERGGACARVVSKHEIFFR
jgi:hypothetical protein